MILRVAEDSLILCAAWRETGIAGIDAVPVVAIDNGIVVSRRTVVTKCLGALVTTVDIHALGIVPSYGRLTVVVQPTGDVVVAEFEQLADAVHARQLVDKLPGGEALEVSVQVARIVSKGDHTRGFLEERPSETRALEQLGKTVAVTGIGKADPFVDEVVQVCLQMVLGETAADVAADILKEIFPVDTTQLGYVDDGFQFIA